MTAHTTEHRNQRKKNYFETIELKERKMSLLAQNHILARFILQVILFFFLLYQKVS